MARPRDTSMLSGMDGTTITVATEFNPTEESFTGRASDGMGGRGL